ncbi:acetyl-/propionyl-CoA carboxylase subunit alpha [Curtobacterium sp. MCJR17_055]|uniref:acetyl/propionyl/methylcrotonyl-CoA carboxylase subunit alpha n=1 Tax=unclassified Curtobacterium TaxID=257496 RepID=UPI000D8B60C4|nr:MULTISPECIES: biotin carboxylase N-terminal domain-containing protein [unclassified Curtobacterium]PYY36001.1 acetyl-/propionyl-CoA carboxylase subunit alpha [Curtobacterium sp. MCBD17_029]PYY40818.1 acetyl-/propionyl-CoA carboxylase subunit alpha [Curtobacterium sp. MCPF17_046]PYY50086.1 acetyl-/propionyl-CoA carboxylase subunit alpha [Curtobacterium sp. MCBD17_023]PYY54897.1 acetyl-/propionyl-CoA carboxylase subunit alpha [Curtobacterium sp. MCJR17_055]PYY61133.1 acetyl-/propionyl-CoA car
MPRISKVLIANRGEIAVRIIRAARDAGKASVAVYADQDRDALHARLADEAYALNGTTSADTYLVIEKIISVARRSGADAVHPGYGFLAENADFARAVIDAGLTWIGPSPESIERLGDKVSARHVAEKVGAPLAPGTIEPVQDVSEVFDFVDQVGLPVAIKAAFGGGGRGLKVVRDRASVEELFESATREAIAAFGRGECFVEKYLDKPRHVETQCLADEHGNVVVVSTRDCSLQRRHQKLVEEAPAPYLTDSQQERLYASSKAILREVGYVGAGTCEFLIGADGTVSFLEVNTRLQVEHCVSEEVTGIDLVREQFRIAEGGTLDYADPTPRGHSFEFRINGEDPGRNFFPAPGPVHVFNAPSGPGVRVDSGVVSGDVVSGSFDSMLAKLIVTGATRAEALERSRRALAEFEVAGLPTVIPFHRAVVSDPAFATDDATPFSIYTQWIETDFVNEIPAWSGEPEELPVPGERDSVVVEVQGKRIEVTMPSIVGGSGGARRPSGPSAPPKRRSSAVKGGRAASGSSVASPMQATVVKLAVAEGDTVVKGDLLVVLEAMKMEQPVQAHKDGVVTGLNAPVGQTVSSGHVLLELA